MHPKSRQLPILWLYEGFLTHRFLHMVHNVDTCTLNGFEYLARRIPSSVPLVFMERRIRSLRMPRHSASSLGTCATLPQPRLFRLGAADREHHAFGLRRLLNMNSSSRVIEHDCRARHPATATCVRNISKYEYLSGDTTARRTASLFRSHANLG